MNDKLLIGLNGFKGAGKDSVGQILVDNFDFKRVAFADKLKQGVAALLDVPSPILESWKDSPELKLAILSAGSSVGLLPRIMKSMTIREFLQRFGTEMGRDVFGENFWVDQVLPLGQGFMFHQDKNVVVTDVRFENEIARIKEMYGYVVRIERPEIESDGHGSEIKPREELIDYTIWNTGNLNDLYAATQQMLESINDSIRR